MLKYKKQQGMRKVIAGILAAVTLVGIVPVYASNTPITDLAEAKITDGNGWHEEGGHSCYVTAGEKVVREWKRINGYWYYFDNEGYRYEDGIYQLKVGIDGSESTAWYCFDPNGRMVTGWYQPLDSKIRYYYQKDGKAAKGMQEIDGETYYFGRRGEMQTDYTVGNIEGTCEYCFGADGKLAVTIDLGKEGWINASDGSQYYVNEGEMVRNSWLFADGHWRYFSDDGKMLRDQTSELYVQGKGQVRCRFDKEGRLVIGWYQDEDGKWFGYDRNGDAFSGLQTIGEKIYYFDRSGALQINGEVYQDGVLYRYGPDGVCSVSSEDGWIRDTYFTEKGKAVVGWKDISDKTYYFDPETGKKVSDTIWTIDGRDYSFNSGGVLETGWIKCIDDDRLCWMYADSNGVLKTGEWAQIDSARYYFDNSGIMATGIRAVDGKVEQFGSNGVWNQTLESQGWQEDDDHHRYYMEDGMILTDLTKMIGGKYYHFDEYGRMITGRFYGDCYFGDDGEAVTEQWKTDEKGHLRYYASDGKMYKNGWKNIHSHWYYFVDAGAVTEDCLIDGKLYRFETDGKSDKKEIVLSEGWNQISGQRYYKKGGLLLTGMQKIENAYYYFYEDGRMAYKTSIIDPINGIVCFADRNGRIVFDAWCYDEEFYYYAGRDGRLLTGLQMIDRRQYYFDENGKMYDDEIIMEDSGALCVVNPGGSVKGTVKPDQSGWMWANGRYFLAWDHEFQRGYKEAGGKSYYFFGNGQMAADVIVEGYGYADQDGQICRDGWYGEGKLIYLKNGHTLSGPETVNGKQYYFSDTAKTGVFFADDGYYFYDAEQGGREAVELKEGWNEWGDQKYYVREGALQTGSHEIDGRFYFFDISGVMFRDCLYEQDGEIQYLDNDGIAVKNCWKKVDSIWYYFDSRGFAVTGYQVIENESYVFAADGRML